MNANYIKDTEISSKRYGVFTGILIGCCFTVLAILLAFEEIKGFLIFSIAWLVVSISAYLECIEHYVGYERKVKSQKNNFSYYFIGSIGYYIGNYAFLISIIYLLINTELLGYIAVGFYIYLSYKCLFSIIENSKMIIWVKKNINGLKKIAYIFFLILIIIFFYIIYFTFLGIQIISVVFFNLD